MIICKRPGCGAPIAWYKTINDKSAPIDQVSASNGNIVIENGLAITLKRDDPRLTDDTVPKFLNHYVTCKSPPPRNK